MRNGDHESLAGRTIAGKFVIEGLIGRGAMGAVFRARQIALEKTVAIKVMHGEHAADPAFSARFHREAKAASRLNHPNSIQVLDFGAEPDGLLYLAMEYLDGRSLHDVMRQDWPMPPARVADIVMQTLAALAVAHDMGVVHRDLKPENVMVLKGTDDDGNPKDIVKVCDFGIAKITDPRAYRGAGERESEAPVTTAGFLVGTPEYMSPEQGRGEKLDHRSDLYSVGVILYEMLTKRVPFDAENAIGVVLKHITEEPKPPSQIVQGVDARLESIALRALKKFREERHASAREMRAELRAVVESPAAASAEVVRVDDSPASIVNAATVAMPIVVRAPQSDPLVPKPTLEGMMSSVEGPPRRGRGLLLAAITVAALAVGASGAAFWVRSKRAEHPAPKGAPPPAVAAVAPPKVARDAPPESTLAEAPEAPAHAAPGAHAAVSPVLPALQARKGGAAVPAASASGKALPAIASALAAAASAPSGAVGAPPAASDAPAAVVSPAPAASVSAPPAVAGAAPSPESPAPSAAAATVDDGAGGDFDPDRAYVEIGMINAQGANEKAVRAALHGLGLSSCYKMALRAKGARSTGVSTLNLSFDASGTARSAVLTGAEFLPGLARCVQDTASGVQVGKGKVDPGGGVAEVTLAFREP